MVKSVLVRIILIPPIERIEGSGPHLSSFIIEILKNVLKDFYERYLQL